MNLTVAASPGSLVEDALQELESLGKQQNALREARDAFDVAIKASEEAKERAKKLAEEVVQTSEDIVDDDDDAGSAAAPATGAHTATSRAKRKWYDGVRTVGSFMLGGLISRLLQGGSCSPSRRSGPCASWVQYHHGGSRTKRPSRLPSIRGRNWLATEDALYPAEAPSS